MLSSRDLEVMLVEIVLKQEPSLRTPEADAMRAQLQKEVDEIHAMGGTVEIPFELPEPTIRAAGGKGSGNFGHSGRPGQRGGSSNGTGPAAEKVRNERSQRALKHFKPIHAGNQRHAERNEVQLRSKLEKLVDKASRTDDNLPVDVIVEIAGKVKGIEVKTLINNSNDKITMRKAAVAKKRSWARKNKASVHTVVIDDRDKFNHDGFSGHRLYYRKGYGSFRLSGMVKVRDERHLAELLAGR